MSGAWKPARDWEAEETAGAPAFAWIPAVRQGPPLADASLPLGSSRRAGGPSWRQTVPVPHVGGFGYLWQRRPPLPRLWVSAPRPGISSLPDPHCGPAALPPTRLYLLLERAEGVEAGAASSSAQRCAVGPQPFPAAATALLRAALGWREP